MRKPKKDGNVVFVVNGYGCHFVPELRRYASAILGVAFRLEPDIIVLCGGHTQQKTAPRLSEAVVLNELIFGGDLRTENSPEVILEQNSFTTLENIRNAAHLLRNTPFDRIVFFCEAQRALKVLIFARWFFGLTHPSKISVETVSWELRDPMKELRSTIAEVAALYIPGLRQLFRWMRIRRAKRI